MKYILFIMILLLYNLSLSQISYIMVKEKDTLNVHLPELDTFSREFKVPVYISKKNQRTCLIFHLDTLQWQRDSIHIESVKTGSSRILFHYEVLDKYENSTFSREIFPIVRILADLDIKGLKRRNYTTSFWVSFRKNKSPTIYEYRFVISILFEL